MKTSRPIITTVLLLIVATAHAQDEQAPQPAADGPVVRAVGVQVVATDLDQEAFGGMAPMSASPGTTVAVLVGSVGKSIVSVDTDASQVAAMTDSQGNSLLEDEPAEGAAGGFMMVQTNVSPFPKISEDGSMAVIELQAPRTPAAGSDAIHIEATLAVQVAAGTVTQTVDSAALKAGALDVPGYSIKVSQIGDAPWGDGQMSVTFSMTTDTADAVADIRFIDELGNDVTDQRYSTMTMMNTAEVEYGLKKQLETATIQFIFHDQMEKIEVPVNLDVKLGL